MQQHINEIHQAVIGKFQSQSDESVDANAASVRLPVSHVTLLSLMKVSPPHSCVSTLIETSQPKPQLSSHHNRFWMKRTQMSHFSNFGQIGK